MAEEALQVSLIVLLFACPDPQRTLAGELEIKPKTSHNEWVRWMENMQDWCISRQLWWGHRCPAYIMKFEGEATDVSCI